MDALRITRGTWIVVCDGRKLTILENEGSVLRPSLKVREARERDDARTRELGTDAPGRFTNPGSTERSAVEQTDWHEQEEHRFLKEVVAALDKAATSGQVKRIVIVAPPKALGVIRKAYSNSLRQAVQAEIDKDLTPFSPKEIETRLFGELQTR